MIKKYFVLLLMPIFFAGGCAYMTQTAELNPTLEVKESTIGQGKKVAVEVVDEREDVTLGRRASAYGQAAPITSNQDMVQIFKPRILEGLQKMGFKPISSAENESRSLRVEIRLIQYVSTPSLVTFNSSAKATLGVIAHNAKEIYEKKYRVSSKEIQTIVVPTADKNTALINEAASNVLLELFRDQNLFDFLRAEHQSEPVAPPPSSASGGKLKQGSPNASVSLPLQHEEPSQINVAQKIVSTAEVPALSPEESPESGEVSIAPASQTAKA
ncbi:MAG: hypothetical protein HZA14_11940 [Nitrospirae bacterium]|nr:hypothetical protein [Nitrospirota bacterium]